MGSRLKKWSIRAATFALPLGLGLRGMRRLEASIDEELQFHLDMSVDRYLREGLSREEAVARALQRFGNPDRFRDECLSVYARHPVRSFLRAVATAIPLILGLGAVMSIFLVLNAVFFRLPLTFHDNQVWTAVWWEYGPSGFMGSDSSLEEFLAWRSADLPLESMTAARYRPMTFDDGSEPVNIRAKMVSGDYFARHGVHIAFGRPFSPDEVEFQARRVAVLNFDFWNDRFQADPSVIGRQIRLDGALFEIVGILPERFKMYFETDVFVPLSFTEAAAHQHRHLLIAGRLKRGVAFEEAQLALESFERARRPDARESKPRLRPVQDVYAAPVEKPLNTAFAVVLIVMAVAWIHASRNRIRETFAADLHAAQPGETGLSRLLSIFLWTLLCGTAGLFLALAIFPQLIEPLLGDMAGVFDVKIDLRVSAFLLLLLTLSALAKAFPGLRRLPRTFAWRTYKSMTALELALALSLLLTAAHTTGLFFSPAPNPYGHRSDRVYLFSADLPLSTYSTQSSFSRYYLDAFRRIEEVPGVERASMARFAPGEGSPSSTFDIVEKPGVEWHTAHCNDVGTDYFDVLGLRTVAGLSFSQTGGPLREPVIVVNEAFAAQFWPSENPVGRHIRFAQYELNFRILGVVDDHRGAGPKAPAIYRLYWQSPGPSMTLAVETNRPQAAQHARSLMRELDASVPLGAISTLTRHVQDSSAHRQKISEFARLLCIALLLIVISAMHRFAIDVIGMRRRAGRTTVSTPLAWIGEAVHVVATGILAGLVAAWLLLTYAVPPEIQNEYFDPAIWTLVTCSFIVIVAITYALPFRLANRLGIAAPPKLYFSGK